MTKRAVIFDFGGVLFKTRDYAPRHQWDARLGLPQGSVERVVHSSESWRQAQRGAITIDAYWADVASQLGIAPTQAANDLATDFHRGDQLDTSVVKLIEQLRTDGYTVALLSNDCADLLRPRLDKLGITHLFDPLVISSEIGVMKPDPAAYKTVLSRLQRPANETIFIDDMLANVEAAKDLGILAIHYKDGMALSAALQPLQDL